MFSVRKIFLSVHYTLAELIKLQLIISLLLDLCSWWQQLLGKTYWLQYQNGVMVSNSFVFRKTKRCRQNVFLCWCWSLRIKCLCDWMARGKSWIIKTNLFNQKNYRECWGGIDFKTLKFSLATKIQDWFTIFSELKLN